MNLLVDVGNTFTKISLYDKKANKIIRVYNFKTDATILEHVFYEELKEALIIEGYSIYDISKLLLSSVTPKWNNFIEKLCNFFNIIFYNVEDFYKNFLSHISFDINSGVGSDIVAAIFGAYYVDRSLSNFLIINLGTASVITCVINNKLSGVVISPGYHISKHALISHAHLLKNCKMEPINKAVGTTTQEAISIGVANGHILMMKSLVDKIEKFNKFEYKKFITGGNLKELEKGFLNYTQESMLIEKGLVYILENFIAK